MLSSPGLLFSCLAILPPLFFVCLDPFLILLIVFFAVRGVLFTAHIKAHSFSVGKRERRAGGGSTARAVELICCLMEFDTDLATDIEVIRRLSQCATCWLSRSGDLFLVSMSSDLHTMYYSYIC